MRKFVLAAALGVVVMLTNASCSKDGNSTLGCTYTESSTVAPDAEVAYLQAYVNANDPTAVKHPSGFFYRIVAPGTGTVAPEVCKGILVKYTGTLISTPPFKFDENLDGATFTLGGLIVGWQKGIPLIRSGGTIVLYVPPTLAYGSTASITLPANAYLKFNIELTAVY